MNSKSLFKKPKVLLNITNITAKLAFLSSALLLACSAYSAEKNYAKLHQQLYIMNNIMQSSAKSPQNSRQSLINSIDSVYLQGQGAIFTIKSAPESTPHRQFFQMVTPMAPVSRLPPKAPVSPRPNVTGDNGVAVENNEDISIEIEQMEAGEDEFERVIEIFEQQREGARELRNEQREISYQLRDIDRQRKDIEYQLKQAKKSSKKELTLELKKIESDRVALNKNKTQLEQKVTQRNKQLKQQEIAKQKARSEHYYALNNMLVETLCLYGNGLKSVPNKEHVSLIIKAAGEKAGRSYKDQIFVFSKNDINACASNKLTAQKLLTKAEQYQF